MCHICDPDMGKFDPCPGETKALRWTCHLCPQDFIFNGFDEAAEHLATHGIKVDRWPDGSAVVIDTTLEPHEFTGGTP